MEDIEKIISEMSMKDAKVLCREVMSINDTMDVLRSKWVVEILSAILYGSTRFKAIQTDVHGISEKVLTERLRQTAREKIMPDTATSLDSHAGLMFHCADFVTQNNKNHTKSDE